MLLSIESAQYKEDYKISLVFNNGEQKLVDLKETVFNDQRKIFAPLRDIKYFSNFKLSFNTISWENELDFAPEFLYKIGQKINEHKRAA